MRPASLISCLLAIVGVSAAAQADVEYGAYLASECTACHLVGVDTPEGGVPLISGWDEDAFVMTLADYKSGFREHETMQMIAARLGDEEMAALAAYFAAQE